MTVRAERANSYSVATRCSWEVDDNADQRHRELLQEFEAAHRCLPLWNDPQRLPT